MFHTGEKIGRYKIKSVLGRGGMGAVFLAEDSELERLAALKVLPVELADDDDRVRRFVQEAKAASALNHPNILTIYEIGRTNGTHFIATEFVRGETLREKLDREKSLTVRETLEIAVQIAAALNDAHEAGIIHRDIKPENLMLRADGLVKVLDFGLAKLTEKKQTEIDSEAKTLGVQTVPGMIMGTVKYMSPEQARGLAMDAQTDIWSFGVCLYEMLAGFNPFEGATPTDTLAAILQKEPPLLTQRVKNTPVELKNVIGKALRKEKTERYQAISELCDDLKQLKQRVEFDALARPENGGKSAFQKFNSNQPTLILPGAGLQAFRLNNSTIAAATRRPRRRKTIDSLAVLPLVNASSSPNAEYFSDGITECIINTLSKLPKLRIVPRSTVFRYKGAEQDPQEIGRELGVRAVFAGRVVQHGDSVVVKAELIDVEQDAQIWGEQYRRKMADIYDLQEEISEDISEKLKFKLTGEEKKRLTKRYTENSEAYKLYLKGRYFVTTKRTEKWIKKGIELFQEAIDLDPAYALAYVGIADAYAFLASSTGGWSPHEAYPKAKAAALRALELDETLGEAHSSLGFFYLLYDWNFPAAEREFRRAIELSPNYPNAHDGYGFYLKAVGRHKEAISECKLAQQLDPLSHFAHVSLGWAYYFARHYRCAINECRKAIEMDAYSTFAHRIMGFAYIQQGRFNQAVASLRKAVESSSGGLAFEAHLGYALAMAGKREEALNVLAELRKIARRKYVSSYYFAVIYLGLGEIDKTFEWLEKAFRERSGFMPFLNVEPTFDAIRTDMRFTDLLKRIGFSG